MFLNLNVTFAISKLIHRASAYNEKIIGSARCYSIKIIHFFMPQFDFYTYSNQVFLVLSFYLFYFFVLNLLFVNSFQKFWNASKLLSYQKRKKEANKSPMFCFFKVSFFKTVENNLGDLCPSYTINIFIRIWAKLFWTLLGFYLFYFLYFNFIWYSFRFLKWLKLLFIFEKKLMCWLMFLNFKLKIFWFSSSIGRASSFITENYQVDSMLPIKDNTFLCLNLIFILIQFQVFWFYQGFTYFIFSC
jgi:hypothetical protein